MSDGRYRVCRGPDGVRHLYLFPPDGGSNCNIIVDRDEEDLESSVLVQSKKGEVLFWSVDVFERLLDVLESRATEQPPADRDQGDGS